MVHILHAGINESQGCRNNTTIKDTTATVATGVVLAFVVMINLVLIAITILQLMMRQRYRKSTLARCCKPGSGTGAESVNVNREYIKKGYKNYSFM